MRTIWGGLLHGDSLANQYVYKLHTNVPYAKEYLIELTQLAISLCVTTLLSLSFWSCEKQIT